MPLRHWALPQKLAALCWSFHDHDRGKLTAAFLLGIGGAVGVENLPGHSHDHGHSQGTNHGEHQHGEHVDRPLAGDMGHDGHDHAHAEDHDHAHAEDHDHAD